MPSRAYAGSRELAFRRPPRRDRLEGGRAGVRDGTGFRPTDAGFTLIEVVVALALFAVVAAAGAGLVTTVLDVERHTAGRLDRLADAERAMAVVARDLTEIADAPLTGSGGGIAFARHHGGWDAGGAMTAGYRFAGGRLERIAAGRPQRLLDQVAAVRWSYYAAPGGWHDHWPPGPGGDAAWPAAVAVDVDLAGPPPSGRLRRVVDLPARPLPPQGSPPPSSPAPLPPGPSSPVPSPGQFLPATAAAPPPSPQTFP